MSDSTNFDDHGSTSGVEHDGPTDDDAQLDFVDPTQTNTPLQDFDDDGVIETIKEALSTGELELIHDTGGDRAADTIAYDVDGDGQPDVLVTREDDSYVVAVDRDGDGDFDNAQTVVVSEAQLNDLIPGAAELLDDGKGEDVGHQVGKSESDGGSPVQFHTVKSGDTLWDIAQAVYGDGSQYGRIAEASGISDPELIYPGQTLTIPPAGDDVQPVSEQHTLPGLGGEDGSGSVGGPRT